MSRLASRALESQVARGYDTARLPSRLHRLPAVEHGRLQGIVLQVEGIDRALPCDCACWSGPQCTAQMLEGTCSLCSSHPCTTRERAVLVWQTNATLGGRRELLSPANVKKGQEQCACHSAVRFVSVICGCTTCPQHSALSQTAVLVECMEVYCTRRPSSAEPQACAVATR